MKRVSLGFYVFLAWVTITLSWWALAFAPVNAGTPDWLVRTRDVCFGTLNNGLPDTYGWMTLILSPGSMLLGILFLWGSELAADIRALRRSTAGLVLLTIVLGLPLSGILYMGHRVGKAVELTQVFREQPPGEPLPSGYPRLNKPAADFSLVNQRGETVTKKTYAGKTVLVTFAYAHCQTVCPLVIKTLTEVLAHSGEDYASVVVTLDPYRDTPSRLPSLAESWGLGATNTDLLSGTPDQVNSMLAAYNVATERNEQTGEIGHLSLFYILDPEGRMAYAFNNPSQRWLSDAARLVSRGVYKTTVRDEGSHVAGSRL